LIHLAALAAPATGFNLVAFTNQLLNGIGIVGVLLLTGLGLAITFGVMRIINLAHGESSCWVPTTFVLQSNFKLVGALIPCFFGNCNHWSYYGITVIRRLYGRPLETHSLGGVKYCNPGCCKADFSAQLKYEISVLYNW